MRLARAAKIVLLVLLVAWIGVAFWNSGKTMPLGTHIASPTVRVAESDIEFLTDSQLQVAVLNRQLASIDRAEQMIILDQSPVTHELAARLLARRHARPNLKVILVTDPGNQVFGGTPAEYLASLEAAGVVVARVRLDRLRDSNPLYTGLWRLCCGWWSDPFDETPGEVTLPAWLRRLNFKSDARQVLVADDGSGGWVSIVGSASARPTGSAAAAAGWNCALLIRGSIAQYIAASELHIARWSTDDDRLPTAPQIGSRAVGSIDTRFLTEGALDGAFLDVIAAAHGNDQIYLAAGRFGDRRMLDAILRAAARGVRLQVLLDPNQSPNPAVASELLKDGSGHIQVHWYRFDRTPILAKMLVVRRGNDLWVHLGSANFTRRNLADLNLTAAVELRMSVHSAAARAITEYFNETWIAASAYSEFADESATAYWRYRLAEVSGLSSF